MRKLWHALSREAQEIVIGVAIIATLSIYGATAIKLIEARHELRKAAPCLEERSRVSRAVNNLTNGATLR